MLETMKKIHTVVTFITDNAVAAFLGADGDTGKLLGFEWLPFSPAIDNIVACAEVLQDKMRGLMDGISCVEVKEKLDRGEKPFIIDARSPEEWESMRIGIGEHLIPVGTVRHRLNELPEDKSTEIITYCKISLREYEAARTLIANRYTNVKVMEGGIMAWPYHREK